MGNSGSMHNIDVEPFTDYSQNFYRNNENEKLSSKYHNSIKWTQSYPLEGSTTFLRSSFVSNDSGGSSGGSQSNNNHNNYRSHHLRHHHHHHNQNHNQPPSHFKVLPDLNEGPQLRNTTNGAIIHSGGTISGRKQNFPQPPLPPPLLQRSRTSIDYDLSALRYNNITRNADGGGSSTTSGSDASPLNGHRHILSTTRQYNNFQRPNYNQNQNTFDLRSHHHHQQQYNSQHHGPSSAEVDVENNNVIRTQKGISKAEKIKNKKRKAPDPPLKNLQESSSTLIRTTDGRHQSSSQEMRTLPKENQERKSRLFKTKAESRKNLVQEKLNVESIDTHYNGNSNLSSKGKENVIKDSLSHNQSSFIKTESRFLDTAIPSKDHNPRPTPPFPFRREKSFDITLLTEHNKQRVHRTSSDEYENSSNRLSKQRLQPVGSVNDLTNATQRLENNFTSRQSIRYDDKLNNSNNISNNHSPISSSSSTDKKLLERKFSQPNFIANFDFKKELQEVTKRRSIALEYMERRREQQQQQHNQERQVKKENLLEYQKKSPDERLSRSDEKDGANRNKKTSKITPSLEKKKTSSLSSSFSKKNLESKIPKLIKTFYFGMESKNANNDNDDTNNDAKIENTKFKVNELRSSMAAKKPQISAMPINDGGNIKLKTTKSESTESVLSSETNNENLNHHPHHNKEINDHKNDINDVGDDDEDEEEDDDDDDDEEEDGNYPINNEIMKNEINNQAIISTNDNDIQIHVRPTLPRRQLEVPQFSPAAAWRMLNEQHKDLLTSNNIQRNLNNSKTKINDLPQQQQQQQQQPIEEKIHRIYREPIPMYLDNKSRDSGISGDGGQLQERISDTQDNIETQNINNNQNNNLQSKIEPFLIPWTPQQDLEGETSSEGEMNNKNENFDKYPNYSHLFSLSLPRESHLSAAFAAADHHSNDNYEDKQGYSSLHKLKRRLSEALTNIGATPPDRMINYCNNDNNWLLSRSVTNSIDNTRHSLSGDNQDNMSQDERGSGSNGGRNIQIQPSSLSYLSGGGKHGMYLPQNRNDEFTNSNKNSLKKNSHNKEKTEKKKKDEKQSMIDNWNSRKYERNKNERESLQDPVTNDSDENKLSDKSSSGKSRGSHRYTFQSAVRQIEKRRIAEKLSREAEQKEAYRLSELEAMRRVEEDFQRKRAKEKASIRQQWRMFSLDENRYSSLPFDWQMNNNNIINTNNSNITSNNSNNPSSKLQHPQQQRTEPEGAVSSTTTPSPTSLDATNDTKFYYNTNDDHEQDFNKKFTTIAGTTRNDFDLEINENIPSVPATKVLSEFHTLRREYLEYRSGGNTKKHYRQDTEHPPVVCQILSKKKSKPTS